MIAYINILFFTFKTTIYVSKKLNYHISCFLVEFLKQELLLKSYILGGPILSITVFYHIERMNSEEIV